MKTSELVQFIKANGELPTPEAMEDTETEWFKVIQGQTAAEVLEAALDSRRLGRNYKVLYVLGNEPQDIVVCECAGCICRYREIYDPEEVKAEGEEYEEAINGAPEVTPDEPDTRSAEDLALQDRIDHTRALAIKAGREAGEKRRAEREGMTDPESSDLPDGPVKVFETDMSRNAVHGEVYETATETDTILDALDTLEEDLGDLPGEKVISIKNFNTVMEVPMEEVVRGIQAGEALVKQVKEKLQSERYPLSASLAKSLKNLEEERAFGDQETAPTIGSGPVLSPHKIQHTAGDVTADQALYGGARGGGKTPGDDRETD